MSIEINKTSYSFGKFGYFLLVLSIIFVIFWQLPISFFAQPIANVSQCRISLFQAQGSIWQGSSSIAFSEAIGSGECKAPSIVSERIYWTTSCQLQGLQCATDFSLSKTEQPIRIIYSFSKIRLVNNQIQLPASYLEVMGGLWHSLHPQGLLDIHWNDVDLYPLADGMISIKINNLISSISKVAPLGSYELKVNLQPQLSASLITLNGPLILNGQGRIANQVLHFEGTASSTLDAKNSLTGLLSIIGIKNGNTYQLKF